MFSDLLPLTVAYMSLRRSRQPTAGGGIVRCWLSQACCTGLGGLEELRRWAGLTMYMYMHELPPRALFCCPYCLSRLRYRLPPPRLQTPTPRALQTSSPSDSTRANSPPAPLSPHPRIPAWCSAHNRSGQPASSEDQEKTVIWSVAARHWPVGSF